MGVNYTAKEKIFMRIFGDHEYFATVINDGIVEICKQSYWSDILFGALMMSQREPLTNKPVKLIFPTIQF